MIRRLLALFRTPAAESDWRPIATAPHNQDVLVYRHDGNSPWSYGYLEIAVLVHGEGEDDGWWLADGSTPITLPALWKPIDRPRQPDWWRPAP